MLGCTQMSGPAAVAEVFPGAHTSERDRLKLWQDRFGADSKPDFVVNAPGRVNLIGEHVDHQDYPVLPCAILPSIKAAVKAVPNPDRKLPVLQICHEESRFAPKVFQNLNEVVVAEHNWTNYVLAAYIGIVEFLALGENAEGVGLTHDVKAGITERECAQAGNRAPCNYSIQMLFSGDLPEAAGLSSSSALVCCAAIAFDMVSDSQRHISPVDLADVTTRSERYVGTASGGMDQAVILCAKEGYAQHIGFNPLSLDPVRLPAGISVVVANTGRAAPKAVSAAKMYNKRVFELRAACVKIVSKVDPALAAALTGQEVIGLGLRNVLRNYVKMSEKEFVDKLGDFLEDRVYTKDDIDQILGKDRRQYLLEKRCGVDVWTKNDDFYLYPRIRHVLTETLRVARFVELCKQHVKEGEETPDAILIELGQLINGSGDSLVNDFDAGCKEIIEICEIGRRNGALGARLTGAGWGGATVHLIRKADTDKYLEVLKKEYFEPYIAGTKKAEPPLEFLPQSLAEIPKALFATLPGPPATATKF